MESPMTLKSGTIWRRLFAPAVFALCCAAVTSAASAATFTANGGTGSSTVGPGGDYPDLASAAEDFTTGPQAVTGNYTFFITGSTTETRQFAFGKNTNSFTVTVKPAASTTATITFSYSAHNNNNANFNTAQGFPGQFIIGVNNLANNAAALDGVVPTNNFVIDGSNNGSTSQDLTFVMPATVPGGGTLVNTRMIFIVGSNNCVVKNCILQNLATSSPEFGIYVAATKTSATATPPSTVYTPTGTIIQNNTITCNAGGTSRPVAINGLYDGQVVAANFAANQAPNNYTITSNTLVARSVAMYLNYATGGSISKNVITTQNSASGVQCAIDQAATLSSTGWTLNIFENKVNSMVSAGTIGMVGFRMGLGTDAGVGTYNVYNNTIAGFNGTGNGGFAAYNGMLCRSNGSAYNIQHNSINIADATSNTATGAVNAGISIQSTSRTGISTIRNNIVRTASHGGSGICHESSDNTKIVTDGNDVFTSAPANGGATPTWGRFGAADKTNLAAWQTATGQEAIGQSVDPAATTGSAWSSATATDLHFLPISVVPVGINGGVATATTGITTDIDGQTRNASAPLPGADEVIAGAAVNEWQLF